MKIIRHLSLIILYFSLFIGAEAATLESAKRDSNMEKGLLQKFDISDLKSDLVYKTIGDLECTLDLMLPLKKTDAQNHPLYSQGSPVVFYFHGGGWRAGHRYVRTPVVKYFSDNGIALVCVSYRFANNNGVTIVDCVTDCFDAIRYIAMNAKSYGIDPSRMLAYGSSAGGHLTQMVLMADPSQFRGDPSLAKAKFRFIGGVSLSGPSTLVDSPAWPYGWFAKEDNYLRAFGGTLKEKQALAKKVSPYYWLKSNSPRTLLIHGVDDAVVPALQGSLMQKEARRLGADLTLWHIPAADHGLKGKRSPIPDYDLMWTIVAQNLRAMAWESKTK